MMKQKRLVIPVLPRQEEHDTIRRALKEACDGSIQVVAIEGDAGSGRSTLASSALSYSPNESVWMASTRFDQRGSSAPFASLRMLLADLTKSSLSCSGMSLEGAAAIEKELNDEQLSLLMRFISSSSSDEELFQEAQARSPEEKVEADGHGLKVSEMSKDGLNVLVTSIKCFFRALSSVAAVVLVIQEIDWGDTATLDVLEAILNDPSMKRIFLCTTLLHREEAEPVDFPKWTQRLQKSIASNKRNGFQTIFLPNLDIQQVTGLLSEASCLETDHVESLAETVFSFTHGNLFHLQHFLEHLQDEGLIAFDYMLFKWTWRVDEIRRKSCLSVNVVTTLASRMRKLPKSTQDVLKLASCFGSQFDVRALDAAKSALGVDQVHISLQEACKQEFVMRLDTTKYKFSHDAINLAAYGLLPEDQDIEKLHFDLGLALLKNAAELLQEDDTMLFTTVYHLNKGSAFVEEGLEADVAELNYQAGTKAAVLSGFSQAASYAKAGIEVLGPADSLVWDVHYDLELKLHELCAKAKDCLGENEDARFYARRVTEHAKSWGEKESSILVLMNAIKSENKNQELVDFCWGVLGSLGEEIPRKPSAFQVKWEVRKMKNCLKAMSGEGLERLPQMAEATKGLALKILCELTLPLYQLGQQMVATMLVCRMVAITKKYGVCEASPEALALAGIHLVYQGHVSQAHKLGGGALKLLQKEGTSKERRAHVSQMVAANLNWMVDPTSKVLDLLTLANRNAMEAGSISGAFQAIVTYGVNYFYSGLALDPLLQDVEKYCEQFLQYNNVFFFLLGTPLWQCLNVLTGKCKSMEEGEVIDRLKSFDMPNFIGQLSLWCFSMQVAFYLGDLERATEMAGKISRTSTGITKWSFFFALIHIANYRLKGKRKDREEAARIVDLLRKFTKAGAINLLHKLTLLEAEMLSLSNNTKDCDRVLKKYDESIVFATRSGFLQDAALANYLCFQYCKAGRVIRLNNKADLYLKRSFEQWILWGAIAVADSFVTRHPDVFDQDSVSSFMKDESNMGGSCRGKCRFDDRLSDMHKKLFV